MNKLFIFSFLLLIMSDLYGQSDIVRNDRDVSSLPQSIINYLDEMGTDNSPILNKYESEYFNFFYKDFRKDFDFTGKKVGFMLSRRITDKKTYFEDERKYQLNNTTTVSANLVLFDEKQKIESGGYDAFIVYWSKFPISAENLLEKIKKSSQKLNATNCN